MKEKIDNLTTSTAQPDAPVETVSRFDNAELWIAVSFLLFMAIFVRYVLPMITKGLDKRSEEIRDQLEQASRLRAEAQALLAEYQEQQQQLLKQAEEIIATAKKDAASMREAAVSELQAGIERRKQQAQEKIARAESDAIAEIRTHIIDAATEISRTMLAQQAGADADDQAVARAIATIEQQIH